jgi:hypothetical protein
MEIQEGEKRSSFSTLLTWPWRVWIVLQCLAVVASLYFSYGDGWGIFALTCLASFVSVPVFVVGLSQRKNLSDWVGLFANLSYFLLLIGFIILAAIQLHPG